MAEVVERQFNSHQVTYSVTNPAGRELVRIVFFQDGTRVGQILAGDAIAPGSFASLIGDEIALYFPIANIQNILGLLRTDRDVVLFLEFDSLPPEREQANSGGIRTAR